MSWHLRRLRGLTELDYVIAGELFDFLVNRGLVPPDEALAYFKQNVYGLNYVHTFSIIRRDEPENIMIASRPPSSSNSRLRHGDVARMRGQLGRLLEGHCRYRSLFPEWCG